MAKYFYFRAFIKLVLDSWQHFKKYRSIQFSAYCIMPSHLHYIVTTLDKKYPISAMQRDFKRHMAGRILDGLNYEINNGDFKRVDLFKTINISRSSPKDILNLFKKIGRYSNQKHKIWMPDDKPQCIETEKIFKQKLNYIHNNPVKEKFVEDSALYPYSSAKFYYNEDSNNDRLIVPFVL